MIEGASECARSCAFVMHPSFKKHLHRPWKKVIRSLKKKAKIVFQPNQYKKNIECMCVSEYLASPYIMSVWVSVCVNPGSEILKR